MKRRRWLRNSAFVTGGAAVVIVLVLLTTGAFNGSTKPPVTAQKAANKLAVAAGCPASTSKRVNALSWSSPPPMTIDRTKIYKATVETTAGTFEMQLDPAAAPTAVNSFVFLADKGYFKCNIFHRVIPHFMDQTGDPTGTGKGGPGYQFANENVPTAYETGDVAMANSGGTDTNGSQFFVVVPGGGKVLDEDLASGDKYSVFGNVTSGMSVVEKINSEGQATPKPPKVVQRILSVTIHES